MTKRQKTMEMREKVQSQGAFSSRAHERSAEIAETSSLLEVCDQAFSHIEVNTIKINSAE